MASGESEKLIEAVTERAREALEEAERQAQEIVVQAESRAEQVVTEARGRAEEIVADADAKAAQTVALSEDQARERIERARKALDELGVALGSTVESEPQGPGSDPTPEEAPEPTTNTGSDPSESGKSSADEPEPEGSDPSPERLPEPAASPSTEELIAQLKGSDSGDSGGGGGEGDAAARLVAMNMALEGASREDVDKHLADEFDLADRDALLDEVFSRVGN